MPPSSGALCPAALSTRGGMGERYGGPRARWRWAGGGRRRPVRPAHRLHERRLREGAAVPTQDGQPALVRHAACYPVPRRQRAARGGGVWADPVRARARAARVARGRSGWRACRDPRKLRALPARLRAPLRARAARDERAPALTSCRARAPVRERLQAAGGAAEHRRAERGAMACTLAPTAHRRRPRTPPAAAQRCSRERRSERRGRGRRGRHRGGGVQAAAHLGERAAEHAASRGGPCAR